MKSEIRCTFIRHPAPTTLYAGLGSEYLGNAYVSNFIGAEAATKDTARSKGT